MMIHADDLDVAPADPRYHACVTIGHQLTLALMHEIAATFPEASPPEQIALALMLLRDCAEVLTHAGSLFAEEP